MLSRDADGFNLLQPMATHGQARAAARLINANLIYILETFVIVIMSLSRREAAAIKTLRPRREMPDTEPLNLPQLLELARDRSREGRSHLLRVMDDVFFGTGAVLTVQERDLMFDILRQLILDVEMSVRRVVADRLALRADAPRDLIETLANDEIEVAYPVLIRSTVLHDPALMEIILNRTSAHRLAIALRESVSERVADALVERGDEDVVTSLLENSGARISAAAMSHLVDESRRVGAYRAPLVRRTDLPIDLARRLYGIVSAALRDELVQRYDDIDPDALDEAIVDAVGELAADHYDRDAASTRTKSLAKQLHRVHSVTPRLLMQTLRHGEVELFEQMLAEFAGLDIDLTRRILSEPGGEALAVLCIAAGIGRADFASIFLRVRGARIGQKSMDPSEMPHVMLFYERVTETTARQMLDRLRQDPDSMSDLKRAGAAVAE